MRNRNAVCGAILLLIASTIAASAQEPPVDEVEAARTAWASAIDRVASKGYAYEELRRCAGCHCHMAVYNVTESGREERYHNMKVATNEDPVTCKPCHHFKPTEMAANCAKLVPDQLSAVHRVPPFE